MSLWKYVHTGQISMWAVAFKKKKKKRGGEVDNLFVCLLLIKDAGYTNFVRGHA